MAELFQSILKDGMSLNSYLLCLAFSLICGIITAFASKIKAHPSKGFMVSLVLLPAIICTVITMVNGNIGTGVAVMGAFSLVRFRSVPGKAKDIVSIFLAMTAGLTCAGGYVFIALIFTAIICAIMIALSFIPFGEEVALDLVITIPESLRIYGGFDDIFDKYLKTRRLVRARTSNMGSLYKLYYKIKMKDTTKIQEFIDELRCRNGNLEISVAESVKEVEEL